MGFLWRKLPIRQQAQTVTFRWKDKNSRSELLKARMEESFAQRGKSVAKEKRKKSKTRYEPTAGGEGSNIGLETEPTDLMSEKRKDKQKKSRTESGERKKKKSDADSWRRESQESSSGVSTMNSDQNAASTPERRS